MSEYKLININSIIDITNVFVEKESYKMIINNHSLDIITINR